MATTHKYSFLISDGAAARERGGDFDHFSQVDVEAETLRDAVAQVYPNLALEEDEGGFDEWFTEWSGLDEDATGEEILDVLEHNIDYGSGDPWLAAYMIDGELIDYSGYGVNDEIEEYQNDGRDDMLADFVYYLENDSGIDLEKWGIDLPEIDEYYFEGYTPTPKAIKNCFRGNPDYFDEAAEIVASWYEYEDSTFGNCEFRSEEDFYANEDIGELIDAADDEEERAIVTVAYGSFYKDMTPEDLLEDDEE
jgi:hypothetical protein